jgi:hypothetical protein
MEVPGGPAYYIPRALERLAVLHRIITGIEVKTEVVLTPEGEQYVIPALPLIPLPATLKGDAVVLSPVMREIDPNCVPPTSGLLVVDLQGFVREPGRLSGEARRQVDLTELLARADAVKGADAEIALLDASSRAALDRTLLVITRGKQGAVVRVGGRAYEVPAHVVPARNTIGAGDTFLAAFTVEMVRHGEPVRAATKAARFTEQFLSERMRGREL